MAFHALKFSLRAFRKNAGFTAVALISITIGIGVNTAIFSVANSVLLHPLPYRDADRLVILWNRSPGLGITEDWFSTAQYFDIKSKHGGFEELAIAIGANFNLTGDGEPERIGTIRVSANLLPMLGVLPAIGRLFSSADDVVGAAPTALLGHGTWTRRYGADPGVIGRSVILNGQRYEIVGVLPATFSLPREVMPTLDGAENAEIMLPLQLPANAAQIRTREDYNIIGKLKAGVGVATAQSEMDVITASLRRDHPDIYPPDGGLTFSIVPLQDQVVGDIRRPLVVLAGSVCFVLLIACANVANLLLARALGRQKEIAVRTSLGASSLQIVRQLLTESITLSVAGGVLGLGLSWAIVQSIRRLGTGSVPRINEISINSEALFFMFAVSLLFGVLAGLAPAWRIRNLDIQTQLAGAGRGASAAAAMWTRGHNTRRLLVICGSALSVILLVGAGLLIRSFVRLQQVSPGFQPQNILTLELTMTGAKYNDAATIVGTYRELWSRLKNLPGVAAAGGVSALPLSRMFAWGPITVEGRQPPPGEKFINADQRIVAGDYFRTMSIPLVRGRTFNDQDTRENPRVTIVDAHMAAQLWPGEDAIGKRIRTGGPDSTSPWVTVVGVVGRVKQYALDSDSRIAMYLAQAQYPVRAMNVVIKTEAAPENLTATVRKEIRELDPNLPIYGVRTMSERVGDSIATRRFSVVLLTVFAGLALALATVGVYGVITYLVDQGTRELGIRMALGATPGGITNMVIRQGLLLGGIGVAVGIAGALLLTRFLSSLLFGIEPTDPLTFVAIGFLMMMVAIISSYIPARRAARIDPVISLRTE